MVPGKKNKKIVSLFLIVMMVCTAITPVWGTDAIEAAAAETADTVAVETAEQLVEAVNSAGEAAETRTVVQLTNDIEISSSLNIPAGKFIQLEGKTGNEELKYTGSKNYISGAAVVVAGDLIIKNLTVDADYRSRVMLINNGATAELGEGAVITKGSLGAENGTETGGAGIRVESGRKSSNGSLYIRNGARITKCQAQGHYVTKGIGVFIGRYGNFEMTGGEISGNEDLCAISARMFSCGGGIYFDAYGGNCVMSGGAIQDNTAKSNGGGVSVNGGTFSFEGGVIQNNTTTCTGGGVYIMSRMVMTGGEIKGNTAVSDTSRTDYSCGGGVYIGSYDNSQTNTSRIYGTMEMQGGRIYGNTVYSHVSANNRAYTFGQGGGIFTRGKFTMTGGEISGNRAETDSTAAELTGCGGGIAIAGGRNFGMADIQGGKITENSADSDGGAVFMAGQENISETVDDGVVINVPGSGSLELSGQFNISGNTAGNTGANVLLDEDTYITVAGEAADGASAYISIRNGTEGTPVARSAEGYDIQQKDADSMVSDDSTWQCVLNYAGEIVLSRPDTEEYTDISSAECIVKGQYTFSGSRIIPETEVVLDGRSLIEGTDYTVTGKNNTAAGTASVIITGTGEYRGTLSENFTILPANIAEMQVRAIRDQVYTGQPLTPKVKIYNGDTFLEVNADYTAEYFGNTEAGKASVKITGTGNYTGTVQTDFNIVEKNNIVKDWEGLQDAVAKAAGTAEAPEIIEIAGNIEAEEPITIPDGKCISLIGAGDDAGIKVVFSAEDRFITVAGELYLENITIDAAGKCGAVSVNDSGSLTAGEDSIVTGGLAQYGSGILNNGSLIITGGTISNNVKSSGNQPGAGGGVLNNGTMSMSCGTICDNTNTQGAGVYNEGKLVITGGRICSNKASGSELNSAAGAGGAIYNKGTLKAESVKLTGNSASEFGGAVANYGELSMEDSTANGNSAGRLGGAIYTEADAAVTGSDIYDNTAVSSAIKRSNACGGGIYIAAGKVTASDTQIHGNTAKSTYTSSRYKSSLGNGGGVYISNDGRNHCELVMNGGAIYDNTARSYLKDSEAGHGGGVYIMGGYQETDTDSIFPGTLTLNGGSITSNYASETGSGVFVNDGEYSYNDGSFTVPFNYDIKGNGMVNLEGNVVIAQNTGARRDNLYFRGTSCGVITGAIDSEDGSIGFSTEGCNDALICKGTDDYRICASDAAKFSIQADKRTQLTVSNEDNALILMGIRIDEVFQPVVSQSQFEYSGMAQKPVINVVSLNGSQTLTEGKDYVISYPKDCTSAGTKTVSVAAAGQYSGGLVCKYEITSRKLSAAAATIKNQSWTGKEVKPVSAIQLTDGGRTLLRGSDYRIVGYTNNIKAGTGGALLEGTGNYSGRITVDFKIIKPVTKLTVTGVKTRTYTGYLLKQTITVKDGTKTLKYGTDYYCQYKNNLKPGEAALTITGKGYYSGSRTVKFKILPKKQSLLKLYSSRKGYLKATWKKDSTVSGYQVVIARNSKFTSGVKYSVISGNSTVSKTFTKLRSKATYYVKVRAYKTISGKKYYGSYSSIKKIKVK